MSSSIGVQVFALPTTIRSRVELLRASSARVLLLTAPAGYGKSTLAGALRSHYLQSAVCNCEDIGDESSFALHVVGALAHEQPERSSQLSEMQLRLSAEADARVTDVLDAAWVPNVDDSLFVFENVEAISSKPSVIALLMRLLNTVPPGRRVVVCSRTNLPARANRNLPPHRLLRLEAAHFTLSREESLELLREEHVEEQHWETILELAQGWPVVLLLLCRFAREGRLEAALADVAGIAFEDLFAYLIEQVLEPLSDEVRQALRAVASVPDMTPEELRAVTGLESPDARRITSQAPFVHFDGHTFVLHPLVRNALATSIDETAAFTIAAAQYAEIQQQYKRAAQLYRLAHDFESAGCALTKLPFQQLTTAENAYELAQVPHSVIRQHRKLSIALFYQSPLTPEIVAFFHEIFQNLSDDDDPVTIAHIVWFFANMGDYLSVSYETMLHAPVINRAAKRSPEAKAIIEEARAWAGESAQEYSIDEDLQRYEQAVASRSVFKAAEYASYIAFFCRVNNDPAGCMEWSRRAVDHAAASGSMLNHADKLFWALFQMWYLGEDDAAARYRRELEEQVEISGYHPVWVAFRRMFDVGDDHDTLPVPPVHKVSALFIAAGNAANSAQKLQLLSRAERMAQEYDYLYALVGPAILAACPARTDILSVTMEMADRRRDSKLIEALEALAQGKPSYLTRFMERFSASVPVQPREPEVRLEILRQRLTRGGNIVRLSALDAAVLGFLARSRGATSREEIQDAFWQDADANAARDALYSMLYRIRKRCGKTEIVENVGNAYRIGAGTAVDIWDIDGTVQHISRNVEVPLSVVREQYESLRARTYPNLLRLEWFGPMDFRIKEYLRTLAQYLIHEAQRRDDYTTVLHLCAAMIDEDNCDEFAHQTIIRTWHATGNQFEAKRAYRNYCVVLRAEMNAEPSPELLADAERLRLVAS